MFLFYFLYNLIPSFISFLFKNFLSPGQPLATITQQEVLLPLIAVDLDLVQLGFLEYICIYITIGISNEKTCLTDFMPVLSVLFLENSKTFKPTTRKKRAAVKL